MRAAGIDNAEGKQKIINELYEKFFKTAFPKAAESLGIVYTPVEIVDFILRSVEHLLRTEFGVSVNDEGVHVLDPFTGTGTFIVRLLQSGLISADNLLRKYTQELHANEINLLAYYVAAVNIEATFHGLNDQGTGDYLPFDGIVLTDTFQMHEDDDTLDTAVFITNSDRVVRQKSTDIRVVVGNPPYSAGQTSANDDNANVKYATLDARIEQTYAAGSTAVLKNSLYDSYIRAIRWASDRIGNKGIIGYVTNGGYIDSNTADGLRKCLVDEFEAIYVYNLRGNARTAGEQRRMEKDNVFGGGSRATVAVMFLVKRGEKRPGVLGALRYRNIGEYLTREQKLEIVRQGNIDNMVWQAITPNSHGDWIGQRRKDFSEFAPLAAANNGLLRSSSNGVKTNRDAWTYNFSKLRLRDAAHRTIQNYNDEVRAGRDTPRDLDPARLAWTPATRADLRRRRTYTARADMELVASYRPFSRQWLYFDAQIVERPGRISAMFPGSKVKNFGIYTTGISSHYEFTPFVTDAVPDLHLLDTGQFFPRFTYQPLIEDGLRFENETDEFGNHRVDNVTDTALTQYRATYGSLVTKDEIFFYVYGLLHSPEYRAEFAGDLKKMLPRIPMVKNFAGFAAAGRKLIDLHLNYETVEPYDLQELVTGGRGADDAVYRVTKMAFGKTAKEKDKSRIVYNSRITLAGVPEEAYRYMLGPRSAVEWIMDRYQVKTDKASGIVNDPNDWATEHGEPRYILDLVKRIVTVSVETMRIVDNLPDLDIIEGK